MNGGVGKSLAATAIAISVFLPAHRATADWQQTRWGDSYAATMKVLGGQVSSYDVGQISEKSLFSGQVCKAYIPHVQIGTWSFDEARLCFDANDHLIAVVLLAPVNAFTALDRALRENFGAPVKDEAGPIPDRLWRDETKGNALRLIQATGTILEYSPLESGF